MQHLKSYIVAFSIVISLGRVCGTAAQSTQTQTHQLKDIAVYVDGNGSVNIFLSDISRGILRWRTARDADVTSVPVSDFEVIPLPDAVQSGRLGPLATDGKKLYFVNQATHTIFTVDLADNSTRQLLRLSDGPDIASLAIAPNGTLAIARRGTPAITLIESNPDVPPEELNLGVIEPARLLFAGNNLIVLDRGKLGKLIRVTLNTTQKTSTQKEIIRLSGSLCKSLGKNFACSFSLPSLLATDERAQTGDIAIADGRAVYADGNGPVGIDLDISGTSGTDRSKVPGEFTVEAFPVDHRRLTVLLDRKNFVSDSRSMVHLAADANLLALMRSDENSVRIWRVKETTFFFRWPPQKANAAILNLYSILERNGVLPFREYVVPPHSGVPNTSIDLILAAQKSILPLSFNSKLTYLSPKPENPDFNKAMDAAGTSFCKSNQWRCDSVKAPAEIIKRPVGTGQSLSLPDYTIKTEQVLGQTILNGETVGSILNQRFPSYELLSSIPFSSEYLMRINRAFLGSLEYELTRRNYVMTVAAVVGDENVLKLNHLVQAGETNDVLLSSNCDRSSAASPVVKKVATLEKTLYLYSPSSVPLPRKTQTKNPEDNELWKELNIQRVELSLEGVTEVTSTNAPSETACVEDSTPPGVFQIAGVLKARGARYRFIRNDGLMLSTGQTKNLIEKLNLAGDLDTQGRWNLVVREPFTVGYRATEPFTAARRLQLRSSSDAFRRRNDLLESYQVRRGGPQDIFSRREGRLTLPIPRWRIDALIDERLLQSNGVLQEFAKVNAEVLSLEVKYTKSRSTSDSIAPQSSSNSDVIKGSTQSDITVVENNRRDIWSAINLISTPLTDTSIMPSVMLGLFETRGSTDFWHPDFEWPNADEVLESDSDDSGNVSLPAGSRIWSYVWSQPTIPDHPFPPLKPGEDVPPCSNDFVPEEGYLSPLKAQKQNSFERIVKDPFSRNDDHGTFVAGLVASTNNRALGIVPGMHLYLYDVNNGFSCSFDKYMRAAMSSGVYVFNISQKFPCADAPNNSNAQPSYCSLKDEIIQAIITPLGQLPYNSLLFVVAAGNEGVNLNDRNVTIPPPVSWAKDVPNNILVVGATNLDGSIPMIGGTSTLRFNSGMLYVDVLAPGVDIYSSAANGSYAVTSGTSFSTPLVSAVAAKLFVTLKDPKKVKARIIYTAEWRDDYLQWSLGGRFHADRALSKPTENVFVIDNYPNARVIKYEKDKVKIENRDQAFIVDRKQVEIGSGPINQVSVPPSIPFNRILRMVRMMNGFYRIIYLDSQNALRILMNAQVGGTIELTLQGTPNKVLKIPYNQLADFIISSAILPENIQFLR